MPRTLAFGVDGVAARPEPEGASPVEAVDAPSGGGGAIAEWTIKLVIPVVLGLTLLSFVTARGHRVDYDLHLLAPEGAKAGAPLPLRAHLFGDLERPRGPRLLARDVRVELLAASGAPVAEARLSPGHRGSLEGRLELPPRLDGHRLRARAAVDGWGGQSERPAVGGAGPSRQPRALRSLGTFSAGPLQEASGQSAPNSLELRVVGGVCVPEARCQVVVYSGAADVGVAIEPSRSVRPDSEEVQPGPLAQFELTLDGPEAELTVHASRDGERIARRGFRLPVALGVDALRPLSPIHHAPALPSLALWGAAEGCIVDAFSDGRWLRTASLPGCDAGDPVPFEALPAGGWRVQVRRDPFGSASAAARDIYVRANGQSDAEVLAALAAQAAPLDPADPLVVAVRADPAAFVPALEAAALYLLAIVEAAGVYPMPRAVSGYAAAREHLAHELTRMRTLSLWALALSGALLVAMVLRRGLAGSATAGEVLRSAGASEDRARALSRRRALNLLLVAVSLALAVVAIAIYAIARSIGS